MIILYSTGCPKCKVLKTKLDTAQIEYVVCDDKQAMINKNFTNVPMLEFDGGMIMDFKSAVEWINRINVYVETGKVN